MYPDESTAVLNFWKEVLARRFESKKDKMNDNFLISLEGEFPDICRADSIVRMTGPGEKQRAELVA